MRANLRLSVCVAVILLIGTKYLSATALPPPDAPLTLFASPIVSVKSGQEQGKLTLAEIETDIHDAFPWSYPEIADTIWGLFCSLNLVSSARGAL